MPDPDRIKNTVNEYFNRLNKGEMERVGELFAANAVLEDPIGSEPRRDPESIKEFYMGAAGVGLKLEITGTIRVAGNHAAVPFTAQMGDTKLEIIDTFDIDEDGRITHLRAYWST